MNYYALSGDQPMSHCRGTDRGLYALRYLHYECRTDHKAKRCFSRGDFSSVLILRSENSLEVLQCPRNSQIVTLNNELQPNFKVNSKEQLLVLKFFI